MSDECGLCGQEASLWIVNPDIRSEQVLICVVCGIKNGVYCEGHDIPHQGFADGSTACLKCIDREVRLNSDRRIAVTQFIESCLPPEEFADLREVAELAASISGPDLETALLCFAVTKSQRRRESLAVILAQLSQEGTAAFLLL